MKITKQSRREAKQLFRNCVVNGLLDENRVRQTVQAVAAQKPRGYMAILTTFQRLVTLEIQRRTVRVENAVASSDALMNGIRANLAKTYGPGLDVQFHVNPELLGGLRIKVGSDVYDGSVSARLAGLQDNFSV